MNFKIGRDNLALTVFVPFDCKNNCKFCTSKESYKHRKASVDNVKYQMKRVFERYNYPIKDVVFTGGEPTEDIEVLKELIDIVPDRLEIYINTTFPKKNANDFIWLVNDCDKISGVNISRHCKSYEEDCKHFFDISEDNEIRKFIKPVRINCVLNDQNAEDIEAIIERWKGYGATLHFRQDYRFTNSDDLHNPYNEFSLKLIELGYEYNWHTQCNVCDTTAFAKDCNDVVFHKGLESSVVFFTCDVLEINDLIIMQDGSFQIDWMDSPMEIADQFEMHYKKVNPPTPISEDFVRSYFRVPGCGVTCGHSTTTNYCGGRGC